MIAGVETVLSQMKDQCVRACACRVGRVCRRVWSSQFTHLHVGHGYRRSESAEETERLHKTSEVDVLNRLDKKTGPGYQRSAEKNWRRSESQEVEVLNR